MRDTPRGLTASCLYIISEYYILGRKTRHMVEFNKKNRKSQQIDRREAKKLKLNLFRVHAESVQLPFILCWAKDETEALDWAKQQSADEWYEHESAPHFMEKFNVEKIKYPKSLVSRNRKVPKAGP